MKRNKTSDITDQSYTKIITLQILYKNQLQGVNFHGLTSILNQAELWHFHLGMKPQSLNTPRIVTVVCHGYILGVEQKIKSLLLHNPVVGHQALKIISTTKSLINTKI